MRIAAHAALLFEKAFDDDRAHRMTDDDRRCRQFLCDLCQILDIIVDSEPVKPLAALAVAMARKVQRMAVESSVVEIGQKILVPTARRGVSAMDKDQRWKRCLAGSRTVQGVDASRRHVDSKERTRPHAGFRLAARKCATVLCQ
jgi:hypothetical protein